MSGDELGNRALQQARRLGAELIVTRRVEALDPDSRAITLDGGERMRARSVNLATGVTWRRLAIAGFDTLIGKGVHDCRGFGASAGTPHQPLPYADALSAFVRLARARAIDAPMPGMAPNADGHPAIAPSRRR